MTSSNGLSSAGRRQRGQKTATASPTRVGAGFPFVGSEKRVLGRCIREAGVVLTAEAEVRLDALPEQFLEFVAAPNAFRLLAAACPPTPESQGRPRLYVYPDHRQIAV
ncbi:MAG: hypothetical protein O7I42_02185 [Alphaproteobacteria bacterium]|nr:hypothetical protein [Alphaproteobacteria bacterium]